MSQQTLKQTVATAAMKYVKDDMVLGVGTGSTVNCLIELLAQSSVQLKAAVSSSEESSRRLSEAGVEIMELNQAGTLDLYIDGADEVDPHKRLIKGGGAALTREKIIAGASREFVCIVDDSKLVDVLGAFPLPVEVIPMARSFVARQAVAAGGKPVYREDIKTDNGNVILDIHHLDITDPVSLEQLFNNIPGVVTCGLFALRKADTVLIASPQGVRQL